MTIGDQTLTLDQWAAQTGVKRSTIANLIARGWTPEQAIGHDPKTPGITGPKTNASKQPGYMKKRNAERRRMAKRLGVCVECVGAKAEPGRTRCEACLFLDSLRSNQRYQKAA